jgi:hypothetical protein
VYYVRAGSNPALGTKEIRFGFFLVFNESKRSAHCGFYAWAVHFSKDHICNPALGTKEIRFVFYEFFLVFYGVEMQFQRRKKLKKTTARSDAETKDHTQKKSDSFFTNWIF